MTYTLRTDYLDDHPAAVDVSVVCALCTGPHLARHCHLAAPLLALVEPDVPEYRPHGTMAQAQRERRDGGHAAMCPACREVWNHDQRRHRARRRARTVGGR
jgi:hypothetical protein